VPILFFIKCVYRIPAVVFALLWIGLQIVAQMLTPLHHGGVAYMEHIGGFFAGIILVFFFIDDEK